MERSDFVEAPSSFSCSSGNTCSQTAWEVVADASDFSKCRLPGTSTLFSSISTDVGNLKFFVVPEDEAGNFLGRTAVSVDSLENAPPIVPKAFSTAIPNENPNALTTVAGPAEIFELTTIGSGVSGIFRLDITGASVGSAGSIACSGSTCNRAIGGALTAGSFDHYDVKILANDSSDTSKSIGKAAAQEIKMLTLVS